MLAPVREAAPDQVDEACAAAARAFPGWRATPAPDRAHVLFKFRELLEKNSSDVAHSIVRENGKLLSEARGALRRGLDVVEFACGIPSQMMGQTLTDISRDVAGQRCLAGSVLVVVGDPVRQDAVVDAFIRSAGGPKMGGGPEQTPALCP